MTRIKSKFLHKLTGLSAVVFVAVFMSSFANAATVASLEQIQGEVFTQPAGSALDAWQAATKDTPLNNGDVVKTKNGSCVIAYSDQAVFKIEPDTTVTIQETSSTQDLLLKLGKLSAKVNKEKVIKPFQVVTPTAVGAVRGTDVDFAFNEDGQLTIDLHDGNVLVYNDEAGMKLDLAGGNKVTIKYDAAGGILKIQNDCSSKGIVTFSVLGTEYAESPCEEREVNLSTAEGEAGTPGTPPGDDPENPRDDIPQDVSPVQ